MNGTKKVNYLEDIQKLPLTEFRKSNSKEGEKYFNGIQRNEALESMIEIEKEKNSGNLEKSTENLLYEPFPDEFKDFQISSNLGSASKLETGPHYDEYNDLRKNFIDAKPRREMLDNLERLADKGVDDAAIDIGHYAIGHASEYERAKRLLKNAKDPYATHILGVLISYEGDKESSLELFLKAYDMGVPTSLTPIAFAVEANPSLKFGKHAERINQALADYYEYCG